MRRLSCSTYSPSSFTIVTSCCGGSGRSAPIRGSTLRIEPQSKHCRHHSRRFNTRHVLKVAKNHDEGSLLHCMHEPCWYACTHTCMLVADDVVQRRNASMQFLHIILNSSSRMHPDNSEKDRVPATRNTHIKCCH
jgi:hypothetical protein